MTNNEVIGLRTLDQAMKADGIMATVFDGNIDGLVVRTDDWRTWFYRDGKPGAEPKANRKPSSGLSKACWRRVASGATTTSFGRKRCGHESDIVRETLETKETKETFPHPP